MITIADAVVASNTTTDIAYVVCIVSFFIAGGVAIYLLWDNIHKSSQRSAARKRATTKSAAIRKAPAKRTVAKKPAAKKLAKRTAKKK